METINTSETQFESDIESSFLKQGFRKISPKDYDLDENLFVDVLIEFISSTQPNEWKRYIKYHGVNARAKLCRRINDEVLNRGMLDVLKNGIKDMGVSLKLCYSKPASDLNPDLSEKYNKNIFGITRQWIYSKSNNNEVDFVLSLNGIPLFAFELKDQLKGQTYENAIVQWKNDRDPKEVAFRFNSRILAYFAMDTYQAWMTTQLKGDKTYFMPFNQGSNGAGVSGGAGNPTNPNGYATSYVWEEVFTKDSMTDLIFKFITVVENTEEKKANDGQIKKVTSKTLIFPRFHQYDVVHKVLADAKEKGSGTNYLIEHSAGSGKSNSIAWIAYRLASLFDKNEKPIFNTVIVVTNRIVLDSQLQDTINSFDHIPGLVEPITSKLRSKGLKDAINDGKKIIICTIQKFLFAYKDFNQIHDRNFAIIIDEAHQGQSGESARTLRKSLIDKDKELQKFKEEEGLTDDDIDENDKLVDEIIAEGHHDNQSFFAFTATPTNKTIELFGTAHDDKKTPFHIYSMRQAIEEGFILDVLQNYVSIHQAFKIAKTSKDDPELLEEKATKALFTYYKTHEDTIAKKVDVIMENFLSSGRYKINGHGKAMIVTSSRHNAVRYYFAVKDYLKKHPDKAQGCNALVAFSGEVKFDDDPKHYIESEMNVDEDGNYINSDKKFRKAFHSNQFNIMVVANKYQTGYDEKYLHSMYVDKKLRSVAAVQTLSRLNRTCPGKTDTFVLDFENTEDEIKKAFQPFYESTELEGTTDVNRVYDLLNKLKQFMLFTDAEVDTFNKILTDVGDTKRQDITALGKLTSALKPIAERYADLDNKKRGEVRDTMLKFTRAYGFITQLVRINDKDLFKDYLFVSNLIRLLPKTKVNIIDITNKVRLEYSSLKETFKGSIELEKKSTEVVKPVGFKASNVKEKKTDTLSNIVSKVNDRYGADFTPGDKVAVDLVYGMLMDDKEVKNNLSKYAKNNNPDMFIKSIFPEKFQEILVKCYTSNDEAFKKLLENADFQKTVMTIMAQEFYKMLKNEK